MTAGQRLQSLSGLAGVSAAVMLLSIGSGATAGAALVNYSSLATGTAAVHLLTDVVVSVAAVAGAGHPKGIYWGERKIKRGKRLDDIIKQALEQIIRGDVEIEPETVVAKAVEIVKPHVEASSIDWKAIEKDAAKVSALLALWQEQMEDPEEEEMLLMMMAA